MKKTMFRRIGAMALSAMMAFSLMAAPAFAADGDNTGTAGIVVDGAIEGAEYKAYQILKLMEHDEAAGRFVYEIMPGTTSDGTTTDAPVTTALKDLIGTGNEFAVKRDGTGKATGAGFEIYKDGTHVAFWVPLTGDKDLAGSYEDWQTGSMNAFMIRFATALRDKIDVSKLEPDKTVTAAKVGEGESAKITAAFDSLADGYWIVTSNIGTKSAVFTAAGNKAEIKEKNKAPSLTKTVWDEDGNDQASKNDVFYGSTVKYQIEITAEAGTENLKLIDTLSEGLTFDKIESIKFDPKGDRQVYPESDDRNADGTAATASADPVTLMYYDEATKGYVISPAINAASITDLIPNGSHTLTIPFTEVFLKSLRTNIAGEGEDEFGGKGPMMAGDKRLETKPNDKTNAALYNVFLGDMDTMEDDGGTITVVYTAVVNENALKLDKITNKANLEYGHDPHTTADKEPDGDNPGTKTETHIYDLTIDKFAYGDESTKLAGAEFALTYLTGAYINGEGSNVTYTETKDAEGTVTGSELAYSKADTDNFASVGLVEITDDFPENKNNGDRVYRAALTGETPVPAVTGTSGKAIIKGLNGGLYSVEETKAPTGYNALDEDAVVVLGNQHVSAISGKLFVKDEGKSTDSKTVFTEKTDSMLGIANNSGIVMPSTGGIGTTIFYVVGGMLILGAGILLIVKKRSTHEG